ncbi:MAG TPA: DUF4167 domain-containing protein [Phenylobacterium sp.]|nr:DUF4167 domain-containing protein [Phenylobacterium sp.]HSV03718.1 DUF4167 domain-containing protein [Phenylobacterium sp.]
MRDFKGMKRQRGRNRGGGGGKPQQQNANRAFDSNGPEGIKVRGNAQHVFEKYQQLARDANAGGDRVLAENYLQHAEHYFRLLRAIQPQRSASEILGRDQFASGFDIDFEDEGAQAQAEAADEAAEGEPETADARGGGGERWRERDERPRDERPRDERPRDERPRDERPRDDRSRDGRDRDRRDRWRGERDDRPRDERPREERPRDERPRDERPRDERRDRFERRDREPERGEARDPLAVVEPRAAAPLGEERGSPVLRDAEGGESHAPAFLQAPARRDGEEDAGQARKPRRRRTPRPLDGESSGRASNEAEEA